MSSSEKRIIVGVDYGTTFSGCAYVTTGQTVDDIRNLTIWPGRPVWDWQVPTRIAYAFENESISTNKWGYEVTPKLTSYSWTKLLLDKHAYPGEFDDPALSDIVGEGMLELPLHRNAQGVCQDYLHGLYNHLVSQLKRQFGVPVFESMPMDCVITLPAIWSEEAKTSTLEAAKKAGFASKPRDTIITISEPEAGAISALESYLNEVVLICDCGGGTVDITTYVTSQIEPSLEFDELLAGIGGKCGSTYIDRNFYSLLSNRYGDAFGSIPHHDKALGSRLMESFQDVKHTFGSVHDTDIHEVHPLKMNCPDSSHYDAEERSAILSHRDMKAIFDPVVDQIIKMIKQQVDQALEKKAVVVDRIVLIGGFAESPYLHNEIQRWCRVHGNITLMCPLDPANAVVRGATIRGLHGIVPRSRQARLHIGFACSMPFREGIDQEGDSFLREEDDAKYCNKRISWVLAKDETIFRGTTRSSDISNTYVPNITTKRSIILYSSKDEIAPDYTYSPEGIQRVGLINLSFPPGTDFGNAGSSTYNLRLAKTVFQFAATIQVLFGGAGENLTFSALVNGRVQGLARIEFPR